MIAIEEKKDAAISEIDSFCNVDYEAALCLEDYVIMLLQENNKFNLIGKSTIADIWNRHILDSAQILRFIDDYDKKIADFGSGAGLPGIVISILGAKEVHLIEKSVRKCEFLNKAKIISKNNIFVHQAKLEEVGNIKFDIITSRALASLKDLLMYSDKFLSKDGYCLFLKGKKLPEEIAEAKKFFDFEYQLFDSLTADESKVIRVSNINNNS